MRLTAAKTLQALIWIAFQIQGAQLLTPSRRITDLRRFKYNCASCNGQHTGQRLAGLPG